MLYTDKIFLNSGRTSIIELDSNQNIQFTDSNGTKKLSEIGSSTTTTNAVDFISKTVTIDENFFKSVSSVTILDCPTGNSYIQLDELFIDFSDVSSYSINKLICF